MRNTTNATARIEPASLPALEGELESWRDGRYRLYTVAHLPFDALPAYSEGGPATVTAAEWGVSTSSLCRLFSSPEVVAADDRMHTLSVYRLVGPGAGEIERHGLDGTKYASDRDARRAAYEAGLLGFMVYERDAARLGLPTVDDAERAGHTCAPADLSEVRLSDCPVGCKVMACGTCAGEQVVHSRTYGCRRGDA